MADEVTVKVKGVVDIVILMDVSGSMQACTDAVKASVATFIKSLTATDANNSTPVKDWRLKVVGYRDYDASPENWFVDNPFVRDVSSVEAQLASPRMAAQGGGDEPESLLDALFRVASIEEAGLQDGEDPNRWRPRGKAARAVIFFTDATFKTVMVIPEAKGGSLDDVISHLTKARIILCGFHPEWSGYEELASLDKCQMTAVARLADHPALAGLGKPGAEGTAAQKAAVEALKAQAENPTAFTKILEQLAKSLSKSVQVELA
jgi:hypothetical protein